MASKTSTLPVSSLDSAQLHSSSPTFTPTALLRATPASHPAGPVFAKPDTPPPRAKRARLQLLDESFMEPLPASPPRPSQPSANGLRRPAPARPDPTLGWLMAGQCVLCPPPWNRMRFMDRGSQYEHMRRHVSCFVAVANLPQDKQLSTGQWMKLAFPVPLPVSTVPVTPVPDIGPPGSKLHALLISYASPPTSAPDCVPPPPTYYHPGSNQVVPPSAPPGYWNGRNFTFLPIPRTLPSFQPPQSVSVHVQVETVTVSMETQTPLWWPARHHPDSASRKRDMPKDTVTTDTVNMSAKRARPSAATSSHQPPVPPQAVSVHVQAVEETEKQSKGTQIPKRKPHPSSSSSSTCSSTSSTTTSSTSPQSLKRETGNYAKGAEPSQPSTSAMPSTCQQRAEELPALNQVEEAASKPTKGAITAPKKMAKSMSTTAKPMPTSKPIHNTAKSVPTAKPVPLAPNAAISKPKPSSSIETELKKTTKHMQKTTSKGHVYKCPIKTAGLVCGFQFRKGNGIRDIERHLDESHVKRGFGVCLSCSKRYHTTVEKCKCCKARVADDRGSVEGEIRGLLTAFYPLKGAS